MIRFYGGSGDRLVLLSEGLTSRGTSSSAGAMPGPAPDSPVFDNPTSDNLAPDRAIPADAVWIDLFDPEPAERQAIEAAYGITLPAPEDMEEIEESSRLFLENGAVQMMLVLPTAADTPDPGTTVAAFILMRDRLITLRHADPRPFQTFAARCTKDSATRMTSDFVTVALLETVVDRLADLMQKVDRDLDTIGRRIFREAGRSAERRGVPERELTLTVKRIGRTNRLASMIRDAHLSAARMTPYLKQQIGNWAQHETMARLETLQRDIRSLADYDSQINQEVTFLLDATLGLISIRQNSIIKVLSLAAILFLPPTIVASVYGMNFSFMPELDWRYGYPLALLLMLASSLGCYWFFRWRSWL